MEGRANHRNSKSNLSLIYRSSILKIMRYGSGIFVGLQLAVLIEISTAEPFPVSITVDASESVGELKPIWQYFGRDEPNYAYMKNGRKLISELGALGPGKIFFRAHNLLTSGDGTPALKWGSTGVYREEANGSAVYDWKILDLIFDTYLERG